MDYTNYNVNVGEVYGKLTLLGNDPNRSSAYYICNCSCGQKTSVSKYNLLNNRVKSCGCLVSETNSIGKCTFRKEFQSEYNSWVSMRGRCNNPNNKSYPDYGGRGISVCPVWDSFDSFLEHIGPKPHPDLSLDRINNDGNYEPGNVKWSTRFEQACNQRAPSTERAIARNIHQATILRPNTRIDHTGRVFGRLTVLYEIPYRKGHICYCRCSCGIEKEISANDLVNSKTISCGCARIDALLKMHDDKGYTKLKGLYPSEYNAWRSMRALKLPIEPSWDKFDIFLKDIGEKPELSKSCTLLLRDKEKGYLKDNVFWGTAKQRSNNRKGNVNLTFNGETKSLADWASSLDISETMIRARLQRGESVEESLTKPKRETEVYEYEGESGTLPDWCSYLGLTYDSVLARLKRGWDIEKCLLTPMNDMGQKKK